MGNYTQETAPTRLTKAKGTNFAREIFKSNFWSTGSRPALAPRVINGRLWMPFLDSVALSS